MLNAIILIKQSNCCRHQTVSERCLCMEILVQQNTSNTFSFDIPKFKMLTHVAVLQL